MSEMLTEQVEDIRRTVHELQNTKQDKIKPTIIFAVIIWMIGVTVSGVWWAATIDNKVSNFAIALRDAANDRYRGRDAMADFQLRDQRDKFIQDQLDKMREDIKELKENCMQLEENSTRNGK